MAKKRTRKPSIVLDKKGEPVLSAEEFLRLLNEAAKRSYDAKV